MKKVTKILSLGILFLFVSTLHLSAQKCKFDYNKTDPFSGEATKGISFNIKPKELYFGIMGFSKAGNIYHFELINTTFQGDLRIIIQKGDQILLKLSNGEMITLISKDEIKPNALIFTTQYKGLYDIDAESLQKIAENPPTFIRIHIGSKVYNEEFSSGIGKKIAQAAACILQ
jgi:hypothetical protein